MALTIEQLQALIDAKPDLRELINQLADYLQANPPGGSAIPNLQQVLNADATLTEESIINTNGNVFGIGGVDGSVSFLPTGIEYNSALHTFSGPVVLADIVPKDFADDTAAAIGGIEIGEDYHNNGAKRVRIA